MQLWRFNSASSQTRAGSVVQPHHMCCCCLCVGRSRQTTQSTNNTLAIQYKCSMGTENTVVALSAPSPVAATAPVCDQVRVFWRSGVL